MSLLRSLIGRLTYANVVATAALFIAVGGVSYAAISLPAGSVGQKQIRAGAVTERDLDFPLGVRSATEYVPNKLGKGPCNSPRRPGSPPLSIDCPLSTLGGPYGAPAVKVTMSGPGHILASAVLGLADTESRSANGSATVRVGLVVDRQLSQRVVTLNGDDQEQVPMEALVAVGGGEHVVRVQEAADYTSYEPGEVVVDPVSLDVTMLP